LALAGGVGVQLYTNLAFPTSRSSPTSGTAQASPSFDPLLVVVVGVVVGVDVGVEELEGGAAFAGGADEDSAGDLCLQRRLSLSLLARES